jgi:hypothetical protein
VIDHVILAAGDVERSVAFYKCLPLSGQPNASITPNRTTTRTLLASVEEQFDILAA